jgi:hypothetical protein
MVKSSTWQQVSHGRDYTCTMGQELACIAHHRDVTSEGRAQLETDELRFRGAFRVTVPYREITAARAESGTLRVDYPGGPLELELGDRAERWATAVLHPKSVAEKLGVKAGQRVAIRGFEDSDLRALVRDRGAELVETGGDIDHLFVAAESQADLAELPRLRQRLAPTGGLWTIRRKGKDAELGEAEVRAAGRAAGLVDVKVVRFSETHTADKFVIPKEERP